MINMIVAVSKNGVIGKNNSLPWKIPEDLKLFKELTMNGVLYVGKNTASTLPPLKGREIIVLERDKYPTLSNIGALDKPEWIIGGATIYSAALEKDIVDIAYITIIDEEYEGDTVFSIAQFIEPRWNLINEKTIRADSPFVKLQEWRRRR